MFAISFEFLNHTKFLFWPGKEFDNPLNASRFAIPLQLGWLIQFRRSRILRILKFKYGPKICFRFRKRVANNFKLILRLIAWIDFLERYRFG